MIELTIAVASAFIAASLAICQFVLPNALALILTGVLNEEHSAVTWSVASRFFLSSDWPTFLRSEAVATSGVSKKISIVTWTKPVGLLLIAVAAVTTPLGLYDDIKPVGRLQNVEFVYVSDNSMIGVGTPPRSDRGFRFARACSNYACPGDPDLGNVTYTTQYKNESYTGTYRILLPSISPKLIDLYQGDSDDRSPSLSGYFDIQARQWNLYTDPKVAGNGSMLQAKYKYLSNIMAENRIELVEGLIVDTVHGGVGFRNHSVPDANSLYGAEWEEDILWMQPEAACVNTNLTAVYTGSLSTSYLTARAELVDRGGFSNIQRVSPYYTAPNTTRNYVFENAQSNPYLYERAYFLAWGNNAIAMEYLNITDPGTNRSRISSTLGQRFQVNGTFTTVNIGYQNDFFSLGRMSQMLTMPTAYNLREGANYTDRDNPLIPNPHKTTSDQLIRHASYVKGALGGDTVNISTLDIAVGFVAPPAVAINRSDPNNASSLTTWERSFYACAAATKMSIKTVRFRYNSTRFAKLSNLEVLSINDKVYGSQDEKPVWGFETPWWNATTTWNLSNIEPLWGLLKKPAPSSRDVAILQSDRFYIPASYGTTGSLGWKSSVGYVSYTPGTTGPSEAWSVVLGRNYFLSDDTYTLNDQRQQNFYSALMVNTTGTALLMNLIWTDQAANILVGTRGPHTPRYQSQQKQTLRQRSDGTNFASLSSGQFPVYFLDRRIHYRWIYGIPAFLCIALIGGVVAVAFVSFICGLGTIARLRWFMFNSTSGRVLASQKYPDVGANKSTTTKEWLKNVGHRNVAVSGYEADYEMHRLQSMNKRPPAYERVAQREETE